MTQQDSSKTSNLKARILRLLMMRPVATAAILVLMAAVVAPWLLSSGKAENQAQPAVPVERGPLTISISESGAVKSQEQIILKSEVEGRTTILFLVSEGTGAKVGDLLVEMDASQLEEQKTSQQITVMNAEASFIRAKENLEVTKSQAASDVARAELDQRFAQIDLDKYLEGEYPKQLQKAESDITLSAEEQQRAADDLDWSQKLADEGYITRTEKKGDELAKKRADLNLEQSKTELALLKEYTFTREKARLESDVEQTVMALDRVKRKASADVIQAEADFKARESELQRQKDKLDKIIDQITKCRITSPVEGMVVYATTVRSDRRGGQEPLAEGQEVRERQELIYLPTAAAMKAEIKVQESSLRKVSVGMPVRVTVDALPGEVFYGTVAKIGLLPDAQSQWLNPDLTVYATEINLQGNMEGLRPGMSCRAEIIVDRYEDALFVPVQAVTRIGGKPTAYVKGDAGYEPRTIEIGLDNNRVIRVLAGLTEGEYVSLTPPLEPSSLGAEGEGATDAYAGLPVPAGTVGSSDSLMASSAPPQGAEQAAGFDPAKLRTMSSEERRALFENMTDEQRAAMRAQSGAQRPNFENMTEEQRAAMRAQFGGRRGESRGQRDAEGQTGGAAGDQAGSTDSNLDRPRFREGGRPNRDADGAAGAQGASAPSSGEVAAGD